MKIPGAEGWANELEIVFEKAVGWQHQGYRIVAPANMPTHLAAAAGLRRQHDGLVATPDHRFQSLLYSVGPDGAKRKARQKAENDLLAAQRRVRRAESQT